MALTPWQKIAIMLAGFAIVSVTVVAVACTVFPGGCLFPIFCRNDDKGTGGDENTVETAYKVTGCKVKSLVK